MAFEELAQAGKKHFPDLEIKFKDKSLFMKILGILMFFNKGFMTNYTTTIGSSVYFPSESFLKSAQISSMSVLLHELVHIYDSKKINGLLFSFLYLFPQILVLLCLPLFFLITWKVMLPITLLCLLPLPAYFRMLFERRAYMVSLYCMNELSKKYKFKYDVDNSAKEFLKYFKGAFYYFMWIFPDLDKKMIDAAEKIKNNQKPYEDKVFDIIDDLLTVC